MLSYAGTNAPVKEPPLNESLRLFLHRRLLTTGLSALVVMNEHGELLGCCGQGMDPARAAELAPALFNQQFKGHDGPTTRLWVDAIPLEDQTVYVFSLGNNGPVVADHETTRAGIRDILQHRPV